jgi:hypothetical protein
LMDPAGRRSQHRPGDRGMSVRVHHQPM